MIRLHPPTTPLPFSARCFHVDLHLVSLVTATTFLRRLERGRKTILSTCSAQKNGGKGVYGNLSELPKVSRRYDYFSVTSISLARIFKKMSDRFLNPL